MNIGKIFGDSNLERVEDFVNGFLNTPVESEVNVQDTTTSDFLDSFFSKDETDQVEQLLSKFTIPTERLLRYNAYDELYRSVPMIKRIIKVYKPYVLQKNPVTGSWYLLREKEATSLNEKQQFERESRIAKAFITDVIKNFKLLYKLKNQILHNKLIYGNVYVEVVNLSEAIKEVDLKKLVLTESHSGAKKIERLKEEVNNIYNISQLHLDSIVETLADNLIKVDDDTSEQVDKKSKYQNSVLRVHLPHNIIPLQTKYGTQLGFLEVDPEENQSSTSNIDQTLSSITNKIANLSTSQSSGGLVQARDEIVEKIIVHILRKVTSKQVKFDDKTIKDLKRFIVEQNIAKKNSYKQVRVRFIPMSRMVEFSMPSSDDYPFGESIIDPLMLPGKLFILSQLANIMMKLSRAPLTRDLLRLLTAMLICKFGEFRGRLSSLLTRGYGNPEPSFLI